MKYYLLVLLLLAQLAAQAQHVGIGTTAPTQALDVNGRLRVRGLSGAGGGLPQVQADGTLGLYSPAYSAASDPYAAQPVLLNPSPAGGTTTGSFPSAVAVSGTTAYVTNYYGSTLQVFDVSSPASPALLGHAATDNGPISVAVSGTTAYVVNADSNTLQVFDVSSPASPALLGSVATDSSPTSVAVSGTTAYVINYYGNTLQVFDVSSPASPALLSTVPTGNNPRSVAVSGTTAYVVNAGSNTLQAFQVGSVRALGLQADGSLGLASVPLLTLSGQNLSISGGNTVTLPATPGDNLGNHVATHTLNLNSNELLLAGTGDPNHGLGYYGGSKRWNGLAVDGPVLYGYSGGVLGTTGGSRTVLAWNSSGQVGIGTGSPASQLANSATNVAGSDGFGVGSASLTWASSEQGYTAAVYNSNTTGAGGGGLAVKVATSSSGTAALDISRGSQATAGTTLLRVRADGNVGIGTGSPAATLDVAGYTRLAGGGVPASASGASVPAVAVLELDATLSTVAGGQVILAHGLSDAKILSITALASGASGNTIPPGFTLNTNGELYGVYLYANQVVLQTGPTGTSASILGKAVRVLITYRQ